MSRNNVHVLYCDTEKKFSIARLEQLIDSKWKSAGWDLNELEDHILNRIFIVRPDTTNGLKEFISGLEKIITDKDIRLVVIDSIAAILRAEYGPEEILARQDVVAHQASHLKFIATKFNIPVIITNQVTSAGEEGRKDPGDIVHDDVIPALGTKWSHCVNTRLSLEWTPDHRHRIVNVWKSPMCSNVQLKYVITESGVDGVDC
eukprot:g3239.t1